VALGGIAFRRARTTTNPLKPEAASSLVIAGVYRYTRNPMYVGVACVLVGWAVYRGSLPAFVVPVLFVLFITRFQIIPEERVLSAKFGPKFAEYQAKVRRWL
jgi:protein-S-isoprenylcysteine O-methyltransferase Ste14